MPEKILQIRQPSMPELRFEWHSIAKRVYVIQVEQKPLMGNPIAFEITCSGDAHNAVLVWLRGYHAGKAAKERVLL